MSNDPTTRRRFVQTTTAAAVLGLAGCSARGDDSAPNQETATETQTANSTESTATSAEPTENTTETTSSSPDGSDSIAGPKHGDDLPEDESPLDGYPPEFDTRPEERRIDTDSFDTISVGDFEIPLVPVDVAYYWYARGEARFVDSRSESEYQVSHVFGSVLSPAGDHSEPDPVYDWPKDDRVVTYCDCPHHLASMRAGDLLNRGWENVYAIDEGFGEWRERNYPLAGSDTDRVPTVWTIEGTTDELYGGQTAWARHLDSDQKEGTEISSDGSYELHVKFVDVTANSEIRIETPAYSVTGTLGEFANGFVTADGELTAASPTTDAGNETTSESATLSRFF
jgi:rhodanese-related sulfurtransferase